MGPVAQRKNSGARTIPATRPIRPGAKCPSWTARRSDNDIPARLAMG